MALNFADIAEQFKDMISYKNMDVVVTTEDRIYSKATTLQLGLSPLIGKLKPAATRFYLKLKLFHGSRTLQGEFSIIG